jgi:hypothetical protein
LPLAILALALGCSDTKPKNLTKNKLSFGDGSTNTPDSFKFNFAYRDPAAASPLNLTVYLQGATDTKTSLISACNLAGTNCVCEFLTAAETEIIENATGGISYDQTGNYFRCDFPGTAAQLATLAKVRIRNQNSTVTSAIYDVDTSLTAAKILGDELSMNNLRTVYKFDCLMQFLQKSGTSTTNFDCSSSGSLCGSPGSPNGDFCLLLVNFPYYIYSSNSSTNFDQKPSDLLYGTAGNLCGLQVKQYNCAGASGVPTAQFGLYGEQKGVFETNIQMSPGPNTSLSTYGFAAKTSTYNGNTVCPPGMERRAFYQSTVAPSATWISNNMSSEYVLKQVSPTGTVPSAVSLSRVKGYDCNGSGCSIVDTGVGLVADGTITTYNYGLDTTSTEFCVIPAALLP